jgi:hypothetical protein
MKRSLGIIAATAAVAAGGGVYLLRLSGSERRAQGDTTAGACEARIDGTQRTTSRVWHEGVPGLPAERRSELRFEAVATDFDRTLWRVAPDAYVEVGRDGALERLFGREGAQAYETDLRVALATFHARLQPDDVVELEERDRVGRVHYRYEKQPNGTVAKTLFDTPARTVVARLAYRGGTLARASVIEAVPGEAEVTTEVELSMALGDCPQRAIDAAIEEERLVEVTGSIALELAGPKAPAVRREEEPAAIAGRLALAERALGDDPQQAIAALAELDGAASEPLVHALVTRLRRPGADPRWRLAALRVLGRAETRDRPEVRTLRAELEKQGASAEERSAFDGF